MEEPREMIAPPQDVCRIAQDLIRFDTTNYGSGRSEGEGECAEYVRSMLEDVGLSCQLFEAEPNRTNLVARWEGRDRSLPGLMLHGHLDVVPADASRWSVDPFQGVIKDGMLWGRGAVDMKDMDAMIIASVQSMIRDGEQPNRDVVLTFFADEEAGCERGSVWMVNNHPEAFAGVQEAISEVGGYSIDIRGTRAYLIQTGEKGVLWLRLRARGRAGHASQINTESAITSLAEAVVRLGNTVWPVSLTETTSQLLERVRQIGGLPDDLSAMEVAEATGVGARFITASLQNVGNVTMVNAGYKENVVPESADALIDVRFLPGQRELVLHRVRELAGDDIDVDIEMDLIALETSFDGPLVDAMERSLNKLDPDAEVLPYLLPAGTDNKALSRLGIRGFGFAPLKLPSDLDFPALFHGVDERVPLDALRFGQAVLTDLIRSY
jgi:acetylornithine deacetylase/succinyl-diaminopimelate desuccinylase-like protein